MFLQMTFEEALRRLVNPEIVFTERLVPAEVPGSPNSPYRPDYDWLFIYERKIARRLEPWLGAYRYELIGEHGILCEALSNAFCHGHSKNKHLPIVVTCYLGSAGLLIRIEDAGRGFDAPRCLREFKRGESYFHIAGNGMRHMAASPHFGVFYSSSGNTFYLLHLFGLRMESMTEG